jgi:hypothetical protein
MDRRKLNWKRKKVDASSILEVLVAMIVILIVFSMAMIITDNVTRSSLSTKKIAAQAAVNDLLIKDESVTKIETQTIKENDFNLEQEVEIYQNNQALLKVHVTAYDENKNKVFEQQRILIKNE